jgi:hypothetical protein
VSAALQALDEALETSKRTTEALLLAEILGLRAQLLHARDPANTELWRGQLLDAIAAARAQGASLLELRSLKALCRLASAEQATASRARLAQLVETLRGAGESDGELHEVDALLASA